MFLPWAAPCRPPSYATPLRHWRLSSRGGHLTSLGQQVEWAAIGSQHGAAAGQDLPPAYRDIDIPWVDLERVAAPARNFGRDQGRPAAEERVVDRIPGRAVVQDRPTHAL